MQRTPDVDLHIAWVITHGTPLGQRQQNQLLDCLVTFQMQRVNCRSWIVQVKSMPYARTNAGRLKSEMIWIDPQIQEQQAALYPAGSTEARHRGPDIHPRTRRTWADTGTGPADNPDWTTFDIGRTVQALKVCTPAQARLSLRKTASEMVACPSCNHDPNATSSRGA